MQQHFKTPEKQKGCLQVTPYDTKQSKSNQMNMLLDQSGESHRSSRTK